MCEKKIVSEPYTDGVSNMSKKRNYDHPFIPLEFYLLERKHTYLGLSSPSGDLLGWKGEIWECPLNSGSFDKCVFHSVSSNSKEKKEAINEELEKNTDKPFEIMEAELPHISIKGENVNRPIRFINCEIQSLQIQGVFEDTLCFSNSIVRGSTKIQNIDLGGNRLNMTNVKFEGELKLEDYIRADRINIMSSKVENGMESIGSNGVAEFDCVVYARHTKFSHTVNLEHTNFNDRITLRDSIFRCLCKFRYSEFENTADFFDCEFYDRADFKFAKFYEDIWLNEVDFNGHGFFENCLISSGTFGNTDLRRCYLKHLTIEDSSLDNADFRGSFIKGCSFENVHINQRTRFLGSPDVEIQKNSVRYSGSIIPFKNRDLKCYHDISSDFRQNMSFDREYKSSLNGGVIRTIWSRIFDSDFEQKRSEALKQISDAESVYITLEDVATDASESKVQSQSFIHRKELSRKRYVYDLFSKNEAYMQPLSGYIRSTLSKLSMLYGESPWRIIGWSTLVVVICGVLYQFFDLVEPNPESIAEAMYYSTLIYTSLGFGSFNPVGLGKYLAAFQTSLGLIMLALLVFVLGRRATR